MMLALLYLLVALLSIFFVCSIAQLDARVHDLERNLDAREPATGGVVTLSKGVEKP